ncbi:MAG: hypothetical protein V3W41_09875 [Planctomycetota bacterium]
MFLTGFNWNADWARRKPDLMKRLGVNLVDGMLRGGLTESGKLDDDWFRERSKPHLNQMLRDNIAVDFMNEPAFQGTGRHTFSNWQGRLKKKYGSLNGLNKAWGTTFVLSGTLLAS